MKCEKCSSIGGSDEDECMIQASPDLQHLLFDKGGDNYGCRLRANTIDRIRDLSVTLMYGHGRYIVDVTADEIIWREPTAEEAAEDAATEKEYEKIINRIKRRGDE